MFLRFASLERERRDRCFYQFKLIVSKPATTCCTVVGGNDNDFLFQQNRARELVNSNNIVS